MKHKGAIFFAFTVLLFLALTVPESSRAGSQKVRMNVLGMTCEFCERALEKNLARVPGVESARAWLDKGLAEVTLKKGARVDIEKLTRAVKDGGLTLKNIEVSGSGNLVKQEGKPVKPNSGK